MRTYEAMFIFRPDLNESERTKLFEQVKDTLEKFNVTIKNAAIWAEKRGLFFPLMVKGNPTKFREGLYYLIEFESEPDNISKVNAAYLLNDNIMRLLISLQNESQEKTLKKEGAHERGD